MAENKIYNKSLISYFEYCLSNIPKNIEPQSPPLKYEKNAVNSKVIEQANKALEGKYSFKNYKEVDLGKELDWHANPYKNRSWCWALHSWFFFDWHIVAVENNSDKEKHISAMTDALKSWYRQFLNIDSFTKNEFPWHDHATALRLDRIIAFYELCNEQLGDNLKKIIYELVSVHCDILCHNEFYSKHTNHGFDQSIALFHAATNFNSHPRSTIWKEIAAHRYVNEIEFAFTSEGVHVENSPAYHRGMMLNVIRSLRIINASDNEFIENDKIQKMMSGALDFLISAARYDKKLSFIGDTEEYSVKMNELEEIKILDNYKNYQHLVSDGREGEARKGNVSVFKKSGYVFYRSDWNDITNSTHLAFKCGFLSSYHRQDDDLNILLSAYGQDWLIDSGLYSYQQKDPKRIYMRSAYAHNIPVIEGINVSRMKETVSNGTFIKSVQENYGKDIAMIRAVTSMYNGHKIERMVRVINESNFLIRDIIDKVVERKISWLFHVDIDKRIKINENGFTVHGTNAKMTIKYEGDDKLDLSLHSGFKGKYKSIFSNKMGNLTDSQVLVFTGRSIKKAHFRIKLFQTKKASKEKN
jgi:hypothetical protein